MNHKIYMYRLSYYITFLVILHPDDVADIDGVDGVDSTSDGEMHVS